MESLARLRITASRAEQWAVNVELDGQDISRYVSRLILHPISGDGGAIEATVTFYVSNLEVDVPTALTLKPAIICKDDVPVEVCEQIIAEAMKAALHNAAQFA